MLANLGVSYAHAGKRTLLIDCDLRRPGLTKLFEMRGQGGVSEILRSDDDLGADVRRRGSRPPASNAWTCCPADPSRRTRPNC